MAFCCFLFSCLGFAWVCFEFAEFWVSCWCLFLVFAGFFVFCVWVLCVLESFLLFVVIVLFVCLVAFFFWFLLGRFWHLFGADCFFCVLVLVIGCVFCSVLYFGFFGVYGCESAVVMYWLAPLLFFAAGVLFLCFLAVFGAVPSFGFCLLSAVFVAVCSFRFWVVVLGVCLFEFFSPLLVVSCIFWLVLCFRLFCMSVWGGSCFGSFELR